MGVILSLSIPDASRGPFAYHIHTRAVPADGNCAGTGGHFSPTPARKLSCNPNKQAECEAGDLSGKWGAIPGFRGRMEVFTKYTDAAVRLGDLVRRGRSVVVHDREGKRIACASFVAAGKVGEEVVTKTVTTTVTAAAVTEERMGVFEYASVPRRRRRGVVWRG
jgi:Cu/Zn superoxide dismutase